MKVIEKNMEIKGTSQEGCNNNCLDTVAESVGSYNKICTENRDYCEECIGQELISRKEIKPRQGITEEYCIKKFNEALNGYFDSDSDSEGIIYIDISRDEAEKLFNGLFENATFDDYLETYYEGTDETSCDIAPMWGLLYEVVGDNVYFNAKNIEFYKDI